MTHARPEPAATQADRIHSVRLHGGSTDGILGTITCPVPSLRSRCRTGRADRQPDQRNLTARVDRVPCVVGDRLLRLERQEREREHRHNASDNRVQQPPDQQRDRNRPRCRPKRVGDDQRDSDHIGPVFSTAQGGIGRSASLCASIASHETAIAAATPAGVARRRRVASWEEAVMRVPPPVARARPLLRSQCPGVADRSAGSGVPSPR